MPHNSRNHSERDRRFEDRAGKTDDGRIQHIGQPGRSLGEENMERGSGENQRNRKAWLLSSLDYDLNAE